MSSSTRKITTVKSSFSESNLGISKMPCISLLGHMIRKQAENWMWRSPEAHANEFVNKPSDIFSFALVVRTTSCLGF